MKPAIACILLTLLCSTATVAQMQNIYTDADSTSEIRNIHFISKTEGFLAFNKWIGYTRDAGKTYLRKTISNNNVDYGTYYVNLTFGFNINGVYPFNKDSLLVFGHYGFVPAILLSVDQGKTFRLRYHATTSLRVENDGIQKIEFFDKSPIGFAIENDNILKTVNRGISWSAVYTELNGKFFSIDFVNTQIGFAAASDKLLKTSNGGSSFETLTIPSGTLSAISFINETVGWIRVDNSLYKTSDGGYSWQIMHSDLERVGKPVYFVDDSTGYFPGFYHTVFKTTDAGKHWESLQRTGGTPSADGAHTNMFFFDNNTFWAGGDWGTLDRTEVGGGITKPKAYFKIDLTELANGQIYLKNFSKPGNNYSWVKNSTIISREFNAGYATDNQSIDTVTLIVTKQGMSDTAETAIVDTRIDNRLCFAAFSSTLDTGTVSLFAGYHTSGVKHYWTFGDGSVDSVSVNPVHHYNKIGTYTISHKVFNIVDKCSDSTANEITIYRTQNCLAVDFTYTADSFYTNTLTFKISYDQTKEHAPANYDIVGVNWGDRSNEISITHTFGAPKYYNVCFDIKNFSTGCVTKICKPVLVEMEKGCNADFNHGIYYGGGLHAEAKPHASKRTHQWIINDWDASELTTNTTFDKSFAQRDRWDLYVPGESCFDYTSYSVDSLNKKLTHIVYDPVSKCTDTTSKNIRILRRNEVFIKAVPHPAFSQYYSFYAYTLSSGGDTIPYQSPGWRIKYPSDAYTTGGGNGSSKTTYTFAYPTRATIAVPGGGCEIYYIDVDVAGQPCPIYPPDFSSNLYGSDPLSMQFRDLTYTVNSAANNTVLWLFGDGDSSKSQWLANHTFPKPGTYNVIMRYTSPNNCVLEATKQVTVGPQCTLLPMFDIIRDSISSAKIHFVNQSTGSSSNSKFVWHFGTGDSSIQNNPTYQYTRTGTYMVKLYIWENESCIRSYDSSIVITDNDICNIIPVFDANIQDDILYIFNRTTPVRTDYSYLWTFGDGATDTSMSPSHQYVQSGKYPVCVTVTRDGYCHPQFCDSVNIVLPQRRIIDAFPNPATSELTIRYINQGTPGKIVISVISSFGRTVKQLELINRLGQNEHTFMINELPPGNYLIQITGMEKPYWSRILVL